MCHRIQMRDKNNNRRRSRRWHPHVWQPAKYYQCAQIVYISFHFFLSFFFWCTSRSYTVSIVSQEMCVCPCVMTERVLDSTWSPSHSGRGLWPHQRVRVPADFLTLRGEQTKLLIKCPMTERTVGGMGFDRMPFTIYQLFLSTSTAKGYLAIICFAQITAMPTFLFVEF